MKILVTDPIASKGLALIKKTGFECLYLPNANRSELKIAAKEVDAWIIRSGTIIDSKLIEVTKKLKVIGRAGVGIDNIDLDASTRKGIVVMNTPDVNTISAAEHTIALMLSLSRNIHKGHLELQKGLWNRHKLTGSELKGKKIGIIGLGKIGREVMIRCIPFGMQILGYDPYINPNIFNKDEIKVLSLDQLIQEADYVTIHIPMTKDSKGLINYKLLQKMKKTARIINVARGGIINEGDLAKALREKLILGAAIDVYENEPIDLNNCLINLPNILLTPHLGASTYEAKEGVSHAICKQICDYLIDNKLNNAVNVPFTDFSRIKEIKPFLDLSELLGFIISQMKSGPILNVTLECEGAANETTAILLACLNGLLKSRVPERINFINANSIAKELGIDATSKYHVKKSNYSNLISVKINIDNKVYRFDGSIFNDNELRIVNVMGRKIEVFPKGVMLIIENDDVPGVIGQLGTYIGNLDINIAAYLLSRKKGSLNALAVIRLDGALSNHQLQEVGKIKNICSVKQISTKYNNS